MDTLDDDNISGIKRKVSSALAAEEVRADEYHDGGSGPVGALKHARTARKKAKARVICLLQTSSSSTVLPVVPRGSGIAAMDVQQLDW
jgi:hypothetical protein